jgi:hypothetical protein
MLRLVVVVVVVSSSAVGAWLDVDLARRRGAFSAVSRRR